MVRRLKEDIREVRGGFPQRNVGPMIIDGLPPDTPASRYGKTRLYQSTKARAEGLSSRKYRALMAVP